MEHLHRICCQDRSSAICDTVKRRTSMIWGTLQNTHGAILSMPYMNLLSICHQPNFGLLRDRKDIDARSQYTMSSLCLEKWQLPRDRTGLWSVYLDGRFRVLGFDRDHCSNTVVVKNSRTTLDEWYLLTKRCRGFERCETRFMEMEAVGDLCRTCIGVDASSVL